MCLASYVDSIFNTLVYIAECEKLHGNLTKDAERERYNDLCGHCHDERYSDLCGHCHDGHGH